MKTKNSSSNSISPEKRQALEYLVNALRDGDPDEVLRLLTHEQAQGLFPKGEYTLKWLADKIGRGATASLVSILAGIPCFNCEHGLVGCDNCESAGDLGKELVCESCLGLSWQPCFFCGGAGLASVDFIPLGLRLAVFAARVKNAEKNIEDMFASPMPVPSDKAPAIAFSKCVDLLLSLNRLMAVLETTVGTSADMITVPPSLKGRITRMRNEAVRMASTGKARLREIIQTMIRACEMQSQEKKADSSMRKLAKARAQFYRSLLVAEPCFRGTYLEHRLFNEAVARQV